MIDARTLVEFAELGAKLIAGESGARRPILWAHVSELADPTPWLDGGELIMTTGLGIPKVGSEQVRYISRLARAGVAGLAIGEDMFAPSLSGAMLDKAGELALPVLSVRREIPFAALAQRVASANRDSLHQSMALHLRVLEIARRVAEQRVDPLEVIATLSALTDFELYALGLGGEPLFEGGARGPATVEPVEIVRLGTDVRPIPVQPGREPPAFLLPIVVKGSAVGAMLAISSPQSASRRLVLEHVVTVVSLLAGDVVNARDRERVERGSALAALWGAGTAAELFPGVAGAAVAVSVGQVDREAWRDAHHSLAALRAEHALAGTVDDAWIVGVGPSNDLARLVEAATNLFETSTLGVSTDAQPTTSLAELRHEASAARRRAVLCRTRLERFDRRLAGTALELDVLSLLGRHVLAPLVEHDRVGTGSLIETLRAFLESDRSWKQASQQLGIHRQTLVHRVKRIEQLTQRSLRSTGDAAVLWLALRALDDDTHRAAKATLSNPREPKPALTDIEHAVRDLVPDGSPRKPAPLGGVAFPYPSADASSTLP